MRRADLTMYLHHRMHTSAATVATPLSVAALASHGALAARNMTDSAPTIATKGQSRSAPGSGKSKLISDPAKVTDDIMQRVRADPAYKERRQRHIPIVHSNAASRGADDWLDEDSIGCNERKQQLVNAENALTKELQEAGVRNALPAAEAEVLQLEAVFTQRLVQELPKVCKLTAYPGATR